MSAWRRKAIEELPELSELIETAGSPMALWIDLHLKFEDAAGTDDSLVRRILRYAAWSISDRSGKLPNESSTAAACAFYEHLPERREHWPLFRQWFSPAEFSRLEPVFHYHLSADELAALRSEFGKKR